MFLQPLEISDEHLAKLMLSMACIYCMYAWRQTGFAIAIAHLDYQFVLHQYTVKKLPNVGAKVCVSKLIN